MDDELLRGILAPGNNLYTARAIFDALDKQFDEARRLTPEDCVMVVQAFNLLVDEITLIEPHSIMFGGFDEEGNKGFVITHYSQVVVRIRYPESKVSTPVRKIGFKIAD